ncbi:hypothetical protein JCM11491_002405 [Sporobolomyces phaffii]
MLQHCAMPSYRDDKAEFARLCLVSHQFLHVARPLLYRTLDVVISSTELETVSLAAEDVDAMLISRLSTPSNCVANLVKRINVYFDEVPPPFDYAEPLCRLVKHLTHLEEFRFLDRGREFFAEQEETQTLYDPVWHFVKTIGLFQYDTLKVLVMPQFHLSSRDTHFIFWGLASLERYKGAVITQLSHPDLPSRAAARLRRAYITQFRKPEDIPFVLGSSSHSLRYLHLVFVKENSVVQLGGFKNLDTLVLSIKLTPTTSVVEPGQVGTDALDAAKKQCCESPARLISTVLATAETARSIESLRHLSLSSNCHEFLPPHFERYFLRLPASIVEFSLDSPSCHPVPWSVFVANHRRLYPSLRKLVLRRPHGSTLNDSADARHYFGIDAFEARTGIEIEWIPDSVQAWKLWHERLFEGPGTDLSDDELTGKDNEEAQRQARDDFLEQCIVS